MCILSINPSRGRLSSCRIRLAEFHLNVQYQPGIKKLLPDALSRMETTSVDTRALGKEISTFAITSVDEDDYTEIDMYPEDWGVVPSFLAPSDITPEPVTVREWLREHSTESLFQELQAELDAKKTSRRQVKEGVLLRVLPATNITQIVAPESLRPRILLMHYVV